MTLLVFVLKNVLCSRVALFESAPQFCVALRRITLYYVVLRCFVELYQMSAINIYQFLPVEPKPPQPRSVSQSSSVTVISAFSTLQITICAILSCG